MIESRWAWTAVRWWRYPVLVLMGFLLQGCSSPPAEYVAGPAFEPEVLPDSVARVYVYWAAEDPSPADRTWVMPLPVPIRPGTYSSTVLEPGRNYLVNVQDAPYFYFDRNPGRLKIEPRAGTTYFFRLEPRRLSLGFPHFDLRPVEAATALAEIQKCRRMIEVKPSA